MKKPSKQETMAYVADMAEQLSSMCREHDRFVSVLLRYAAKLARRPEPDIKLVK